MSTDTQSTATDSALPSGTVAAIRKFLSEHGGSASAVIQPVGRAGVRITLVGADGVLGDQVVDSVAVANAVVASFDEIKASEWDRELTSVVTPRQGHFAQMAGWVARQTRFPKARNER
ncbi:hypothetical protein [Rhodococcus spongiicola]|uniref:Uncharacterized protein n=1 Tax=Rhodococcus spongiicola TaxID=2487352 RepID=A0A3S3E1P9_9NOCA|nr:hypothetical protein [Rhodococcus spongiicola]RVW03378.1 hypothetical protein EF834_09560 [Rhodococcus spongiicola]